MSSLYLHRFNLSKQPFAQVPDTEFFFDGEERGALLEAIQHAVLDDEGIITVVGEVGTGKTMLCRMLAKQLAQQAVDVIFLPDSSLARDTLMACMAADLGLKPSVTTDPTATVLALQKTLAERGQAGRRVVLLADEAHSLSPESLDSVRMLSNIETEQHKLLQIVLFGQPELDDLMRRPDLRQVRDRIVHQFRLDPLSSAGAVKYVEHRLRCAGWRGGQLLNTDALRDIVAAASGRLRALNMVTDKAMLAAYADGAPSVGRRHVRQARQAIQMPHSDWRKRMARLIRDDWFAFSTTSLLVVAAAMALLAWPIGIAPNPAAAPVTISNAGASIDSPMPVATLSAAHLERLLEDSPTGAGLPDANEVDDEDDDGAAPYYTIQLATVGSEDDAEQVKQSVAEDIKDLEPVAMDRTTRNNAELAPGARVWVVCVGHFSDLADAQAAFEALPERWKTYRPLIRHFNVR